MRFGNWSKRWRPIVGVLAVGAMAFGLKLEGAPVSSSAKNTAVVRDDVGSVETVPTEATRIKLGKIPSSLPIMKVVTANPFNDLPSQLRAAGLLRGPMPLRDYAAGIAAGSCTFDIDCEDGDPCTDDFCDIAPGAGPNAGTCNNEAVKNNDQGDINGDDCSDGLACNGIETCQSATVYACEGLCVGGDNDGTCVAGFCVGGRQDLLACPNGDIDCKTPCVRKTDCGGGGVCSNQVCHGYCLDGDEAGEPCDVLADCPGGTSCVTNASFGNTCIDNSECGSSAGDCQLPGFGNDPISADCTGTEVCDENADPAPACVTKCANDGDCDDLLSCNGVEVCDVATGLCSSPGNPCGAAAANCLEAACLRGGEFITGTFCETEQDCVPTDPRSCGTAGPYCFYGRCCIGLARQQPNRSFDKRCTGGSENFQLCDTAADCPKTCTGGTNDGGDCTTAANCPGGGACAPAACRGCDDPAAHWYPGDNGQLSESANRPCPLYSSGIADEGGYLVTAGPASLSPFPYDLTDAPLRKLGDDYDTGDSPTKYIKLSLLRFAGGVAYASNGRIAFEFYDENGNFVEDVFFISSAGANQIQVVQVFSLAPTLVIPSKGFIVGHVLQAFGSLTAPGQFLWLSTTAPADQGTNDANVLYVDTDLAGTPSAVANFLAVCNGGDRDGLECDLDGDNIPGCPGGTCESVPGVLSFELEGDFTDTIPLGGCCDINSLACNEVLKWECIGAGGSYMGDSVACAQCTSGAIGAACRRCSNDNSPCTGAADCPGGTCDLNNADCTVCEDLTTPCVDNTDCTGILGETCIPGVCEYNSQCGEGACCNPTTGACLEGHDAASCAALTGDVNNFQGLGTDCDPDCCVQPMPWSGRDHCEDAVISVMEIPAGSKCLRGINKGADCTSSADCCPLDDPQCGSPCERTVLKTVTGNNLNASSTLADPDSCYQPQDAPGAELGWFEAIQIYDPSVRVDDTIPCGYLLVDHCCTVPVKIPAYRILYNGCPCADAEFTKPNPNHPARLADARGAPFCLLDNAWQQFGPLVGAGEVAEVGTAVGTYYYPILSFLGGNFEQYQFHIRVEACPDAVCCVGADCKTVNILECQALGGFFLAPPNKAQASISCTGQCNTGSCCTGPGECNDNKIPGDPPDSFDPMTPDYCANTLQGKYVGGSRCYGGVCQGGALQDQSCAVPEQCPEGVCSGDALERAQPSPCPICEIQGVGNCQPFDDSLTQRGSDIGLPGGGIHVADDFKPLGDTISKVCVWGTYTKANEQGTTVDCAETATDKFRIRVYGADANGLPDTSNILGEANPTAAQTCDGAPCVIRVHHPNSANELTTAQHIRVFGYQINLGAEAIGGLDASGNTCYWLEVVNKLDGVCGWSWQTVDSQNNDFSAGGGGGSYGVASARNRDMAFCLNAAFEPGACGNPVGYCCDCDGVCETQNRRDCLAVRGRWRIEDTCEAPTSGACASGASANDKCLQVVLPGFPDTPGGTARFDNTCANADGVNPIDSDFGPGNNIAADIWYKYIATCDGTVTISTCANGPAAGGGIDTIVAAYKDPVDPTQCICPSDSDEQRDATLWYTEPSLPNTIGMSGDENCDGLQNGAGGYVEGPATTGDCFMIRVGGFGGQGSEEGAGTVTITCRPAGGGTPPAALAGPGTGNRYIRVATPAPAAAAGGGGLTEAIRVRFVDLPGYAEPPDMYVGTPTPRLDEDSSYPGQMFNAAPVVCDPVFRDWTGDGSIGVYGAEIMPAATYHVQRAYSTCPNLLTDETCWSEPVEIKTAKYGDVWNILATEPKRCERGPNDGELCNVDGDCADDPSCTGGICKCASPPPQPDFNDISSLVRKFQSSGSKCNAGPDKDAKCGTCVGCVASCTGTGTCAGGHTPGAVCSDDDDCPNNGRTDHGVCISCVLTAPLKSVGQLQPNSVFPLRPIDFRDIAADVASFTGAVYSVINYGPCTCPSVVTCGARACGNDNGCKTCDNGAYCTADAECAGIGGEKCLAGRYCIDGFCTDKCGRCTPP